MDVTYQVNQYLYPLMTIITIVKDGHGLPVFHAYVKYEKKETLCIALKCFPP